jgi:hypothetical protein
VDVSAGAGRDRSDHEQPGAAHTFCPHDISKRSRKGRLWIGRSACGELVLVMERSTARFIRVCINPGAVHGVPAVPALTHAAGATIGVDGLEVSDGSRRHRVR